MSYYIGNDIYDQPIILINLRNVHPTKSTEEKMRLFTFFILEHAIKMMSADVDHYCFISDFKDAGMNNFNMKQLKEMIPVTQVSPLCLPYRSATATECVGSAWSTPIGCLELYGTS